MTDTLSNGSNSNIYKAHYEHSDIAYAVKVPKSLEQSITLEKEHTVYQLVNDHPNIIKVKRFVRGNGCLKF